MSLRVVRDSVGGQRCLIIYRDMSPIATIWEGQNVATIVRYAGIPELADLLITTQMLGLSFDQLAVTAEVFCNERKEN